MRSRSVSGRRRFPGGSRRSFGTSENAVKTQIWIAISIYVLVAIVKKELNVDRGLTEILQLFTLCLFEKVDVFTTTYEDTPAKRIRPPW